MNLIPITNDLFNVANRLKSVNANYQVFYNATLGRFEVHTKNQRPTTLAFVVPYPSLDARTVVLARQSRIENANEIYQQMEQHNEMLEKQQLERAVSNGMAQMEKALSSGKITL